MADNKNYQSTGVLKIIVVTDVNESLFFVCVTDSM